MNAAPTQPAYDAKFYNYVNSTSGPSAKAVAGWLTSLCRPESVVDIGCGQGVWAAAFQAHGVDDVAGVDGDYVDRTQLQIDADRFTAADLEQPLPASRRYDLAICLEVAEHLGPNAAGTIVSTIADHADAVLFSAAAPRQGGWGHINEQWPDYWIGLFEDRGYRVWDVVRPHFWAVDEVACWYQQNAMLFCRTGDSYADRLASAVGGLPSFHGAALIHPKAWSARSEYGVGPYAGPIARLKGLWGATVHSVRRRLS